MNTLPDHDLAELVLEEILVEKEHALVVFNDEVNTFDHVINVLMDVCKHSAEQAEQCAQIIHFKGKYSVKKGTFDFLKEMHRTISERGLTAEVF